ncbi:MAG: acyl-CoA thioesterase [Proteobacteria bacterium]|nr:acyl-CoA thioesterase [Pseudomonadota bacterium]
MKKDSLDISPISVYEEIFPGDTNPYGTAFGGKILALMDRAAGLAAARYARCNVVTASMDAIEFNAPVQQGEIAEVEARMVYTSTHTCALKVKVFAHDKSSWERRPCCVGTLFMVAIGADSKPLSIPMFEPKTDNEKKEWGEAQKIHQRMLKRKRKT